MNLHEDEDILKQKYALGADGCRQFNMWGGEDLILGGYKEYIKCERPPRFSHILHNDRVKLLSTLRPHEKMKEIPDYYKSSRIWEVMRPEVPDQRSGRSDQKDEEGFRRYWKEKLERMKEASESFEPSDDEAVDFRTTEHHRDRGRDRSARSLPPEMLRG